MINNLNQGRPGASADAAHPSLSRRQAVALLAAGLSLPVVQQAQAQTPSPPTAPDARWNAITAKARGQKIFFNGWGGSDRVNAYLQWAAGEASSRFGIAVTHVKVADIAEAVKRVRSEKAAGRKEGGSVDMLWINGDNFLTMKKEGLLLGPFSESLPSYRMVDTEGKPTTRVDFSEPVDGMQAPWGMAQFTLFADSTKVPQPPQSMQGLAAFARANPGRVSYPRPPDFIGTTFLKQALLELSPANRPALYQSATPALLESVAAPLWAFLDALHPHLWRSGKQFPLNAPAIRQMVSDGELRIGWTFNPNEVANEIAAKRLSASTISWQFPAGTVGNTHFLAIAFNSSASEAAQVFINFLLSPEAQARKADIAVWGDPTVLAIGKLPAAQAALFGNQPQPGQVTRTAPVLPEPHASWVEPLEREWLRRYGV